MTTPEHDPEAWGAFMCGNAIIVGEFAKLVVEEEREAALEFIEKAKARGLEPLEDPELWS